MVLATGVIAAIASTVAGAQASPELLVANSILKDAPASGFVETAPSRSAGASGPIASTDIKAPAYDSLSALSLSFDAPGYQRYWVNKSAGGIVGIIGVAIPANVKPSTFLADFEKSMKESDAKTSNVKSMKDAKSASLTLNGAIIHEIAFTVGSRGYLVLGSGVVVSAASVEEMALRQQAYALAAPAPAAPVVTSAPVDAAAPAAAPATTPAVAPTAAPAILDTVTVAPAAPAVVVANAAEPASGNAVVRFLGLWLRIGFIGMILLGLASLGAHLARSAARRKSAIVTAGPVAPTAFATQQPVAAAAYPVANYPVANYPTMMEPLNPYVTTQR